MRERPKSRFEDENGAVSWQLIGTLIEYPEVVAWDREYANECDRLSELKAVYTQCRHWGRWYLERSDISNYLITKVARPAIGYGKPTNGEEYTINLSRIGQNGESDGQPNYTWQDHLSEKNWLGDKGLEDFTRAIKEINQTHPDWLHEEVSNARKT